MRKRDDAGFLSEIRARLYTAVLSDVLDGIGLRSQPMAPRIRPRIAPGDLVFGDVDGVVVVPRNVEEEVIARGLRKVASENATRDELAKGARLKDVFDRYGVL